MTSNAERAEILVRALRAGVEGDRPTLEALYTDDVRAWSPGFSASSRTELLSEFDLRDEAFSGVELDAAAIDAGGDYACVEWRVTMTHTGELALHQRSVVPPTGLRITVNGVTVAEFRGGQICSFRQYWDELSVFEQLGLLHGDT